MVRHAVFVEAAGHQNGFVLIERLHARGDLFHEDFVAFQNKLVKIFKKDKNKRILEEYERDFPARFLMKLVLMEPQLIPFSRFLIR